MMRPFVLFTVSLVLANRSFAAPQVHLTREPRPVSDDNRVVPDEHVREQDLEFFETKIRPVLVEHCYQCHSDDASPLQGNLNLEHADTLRTGGDSGPAVVAGKPEDSLVLRALRFDGLKMPPDGRLPESILADFEVWIRNGAIDPRTSPPTAPERPTVDIEAGRNWWAFQPPAESQLLAKHKMESGQVIADSDRIDRLVEFALAEHRLTPTEQADRRALIRRVTFDLTGLPPTPESVAAFVGSESPESWSDLVDKLLSSPAYGERWARIWLDVARYAEDQAHIVGDNKELFYPNAWMYRDWVIQALNQDLPYDQFIRLQLAADLFAPDDPSVQPALGFIGLGPKYYNRRDPEVIMEELEDRVDLVASGLQGLTVACARCHDHKYDPIPTADYYALAGVFAGTEMFNKPMPELVEAASQASARVADTGKQKQKKEGKENDQPPAPEECLHVIRESEPKDLTILIRGNVKNPGPVVPRGYLQVVFPGPQRRFTSGSGRAELAAAVTDAGNPLTARVIVNRVWSQYFGRGIVGTPSNFGQLGEQPTHRELLDDLAVRFMQHGWSLKWLHRQIVMSRTYQRSSAIREESLTTDPSNQWLWRMPRRRLPIEMWRDAVLCVTGRLDATVGGRSVIPDDPLQTRRTLYSEVSRFQLNPLLARFDFPDPNAHSARRTETSTPLQKLFLMNSPFMTSMGRYLADRIRETALAKETVAPSADQATADVVRAFQLAYQREPDPQELQASLSFLRTHQDGGLQQLAQALLASSEFWYLD